MKSYGTNREENCMQKIRFREAHIALHAIRKVTCLLSYGITVCGRYMCEHFIYEFV